MKEDFFKDNKNSTNSDSSRFYGKVRWQDFIKEQELETQKVQEIYRKVYEELKDLYAEMDECVNEGRDTSSIEEQLLNKVFGFFEDILDEVDAKNAKEYQEVENEAIFRKARKRDQLLSMIEFFKSLLKKLFNAELSLNWQERLKQEIKDLEKELAEGNLSPEEWASKLERLNFLKLVNFLGPINFVNAVIKAITIAAAFDITITISAGVVREMEVLLLGEKGVLAENIGIKEEIAGNFIANIVNILNGVVPLVQGIGAVLSIAVIASVTSAVEELGIKDTRIPYLPVVNEPSLQLIRKPPAEEAKVQKKAEEKPKVERKAPTVPEPRVEQRFESKGPEEAKKAEKRQQHGIDDAQVQFSVNMQQQRVEPQRSTIDPREQFLLDRAKNKNPGASELPSTDMQSARLSQPEAVQLNRGRGKN